MEGKYPRSLSIDMVNPMPGKEAELNYWYNFILIPAILSTGLLDRAYRYEVIGQAKSKYLTVWESSYVDLNALMPKINAEYEKLRQQGKVWPVYEEVWSKPFVAGGPAKPYNHKPVTFLTTIHTNCVDPAREAEFNQWYNDIHLGETLATGAFHTAYRYQRYDTPAQGEGKFLALYESEVEIAKMGDAFNDLANKHQPVWYEKVGEDLLKVRQQKGKPRPQDLVLQTLMPWVGVWRPIGSASAR